MWIPWWNIWMMGDPFSFLFQTQNVSTITMKQILEPLSTSEKAVKMLLNIFGNANAAARLA